MIYIIVAAYILIAIALMTSWGGTDPTELPSMLWKNSSQWFWAICWPLYAIVKIISKIAFYMMLRR